MINFTIPGTKPINLLIDGEARTGVAIIPPGFKPEIGKVFIFFKGKDDKKDKGAKLFKDYLQRENYIGVFPDALKREGDKKQQWALHGDANTTKDVSFFLELKKLFPTSMPVLVSGVSNGGCFGIYLAVNGYITNLSTFAASIWDKLLPIIDHANVYAVHGQQDESVPFYGGLAHELKFLPAAISIREFAGKEYVSDVEFLPGNGMLLSYQSLGHKCNLVVAADSEHDVMTSYKGINLIQSMFDFFKPLMIHTNES